MDRRTCLRRCSKRILKLSEYRLKKFLVKYQNLTIGRASCIRKSKNTRSQPCAVRLISTTVAKWLTRSLTNQKVAGSSLRTAFIFFSLNIYASSFFESSSFLFLSFFLWFYFVSVGFSFCFIFLHDFSWIAILKSKTQYPTNFTN